MNEKLSFGFGNSKLSKSIGTMSLPAGWTCPYAKDCLTKADRITGKLSQRKDCRYRCFSATQENCYPNVRRTRWANLDLLRACNGVEEISNLIQESLPRGVLFIRIHPSGDFYSEAYFLAWLNVAKNNPLCIFYGYTKALPWIVKYKKYFPNNFRFIASKGGTHDALIGKHHLKWADVVFSPEEAEERGLEIDHDDSHCFGESKKPFLLLLHGTQSPGTDASKAWISLMKRGIGGYGDSPISRNMQREKKQIKIYIDIFQGKMFFPKEKFIPKISVNLRDFELVENGEFNLV